MARLITHLARWKESGKLRVYQHNLKLVQPANI
jgi:hypothetical protein